MVVLGATTSEALKVALKETLDEVDFSSVMRVDIFDHYAYIICINSNVRDILREDGGIWINGEVCLIITSSPPLPSPHTRGKE